MQSTLSIMLASMSITSVAILWWLPPLSLALPVENVSRSSSHVSSPLGSLASPWLPSPADHGTYDVIISCLTTLSLCVWTVVHVNIYPKETATQNIRRRLSWMVIAMFLPECVLYCALEQWWAAWRLRDEVNSIGKSVPEVQG